MSSSEKSIIRVLVVEGSSTAAELIKAILNSDNRINVVGVVSDGRQILDAVQRTKPHVITMDINISGVDGFEATRNIMATNPTPIIVVSGNGPGAETSMSFQALEAGALAVVPRPHGLGDHDQVSIAAELINAIKTMSEVKVVRRWHRFPNTAKNIMIPEAKGLSSNPLQQVIAIGASTGGPLVLQSILSRLLGASQPILVVQHMTYGFTDGFVEWLNQSTTLEVKIAVNGETLAPGNVYMAPDDFQMGVTKDYRVLLTKSSKEHGMRPSVSFLFRSVGAVYGKRATAVLLTGMGVDGAEELNCLRHLGAVTIAQDKASSIVHGMPGQAIKIGAAKYILSPDGIVTLLASVGGQP